TSVEKPKYLNLSWTDVALNFIWQPSFLSLVSIISHIYRHILVICRKYFRITIKGYFSFDALLDSRHMIFYVSCVQFTTCLFPLVIFSLDVIENVRLFY